MRVIFELESDAFLGGANNKEAAEWFRPPTLRGLLRFWWRACHGNLSVGDR